MQMMLELESLLSTISEAQEVEEALLRSHRVNAGGVRSCGFVIRGPGIAGH